MNSSREGDLCEDSMCLEAAFADTRPQLILWFFVVYDIWDYCSVLGD